MAIRFGDALKSFQEGQEFKRKRYSDSVDALVKQAQLKELGYDINPGQGRFGQMSLVQRPDYVSTKALERQELQNKIDEQNFIKEYRNKQFGGGQSFGSVSASGQSDQPFIMDPTGKFRTNPNIPKPLNELQQLQRDKLQRESQAEAQAQQDRTESLKSSAQAMLGTIGEVKKGKKYFGPMGNLPSAVAPSSYFGAIKDPINAVNEYGKRKNWESNVNQLLSKRVIDLMTEMKQASKTGATGMGALSEKELAVLQDASTALKRDLLPEDAMRYLEQIEGMYQKVLGGGQPGGGEGSEFPEWAASDPDRYAAAKQQGFSEEEIMDWFRRNGA